MKQDGLDPPETGFVIKDVGVSSGKRDAGFSDLGKFHITASQPLSLTLAPRILLLTKFGIDISRFAGISRKGIDAKRVLLCGLCSCLSH